MSIPGSTPVNPNLLPTNKFAMQILALPDVQYWCQTVNIPGISVGEAIRTNPFIDLYSPGEKAILNPFSVTFLVDEGFKTWYDIFFWMTRLTFPQEFSQYTQLQHRPDAGNKPMPQFSDIILTVLNSKNNPFLRIKYLNCFPISLSDVVLSATYSPEDTITSDVTFRYDWFELEYIK